MWGGMFVSSSVLVVLVVLSSSGELTTKRIELKLSLKIALVPADLVKRIWTIFTITFHYIYFHDFHYNCIITPF